MGEWVNGRMGVDPQTPEAGTIPTIFCSIHIHGLSIFFFCIPMPL